MLKETSYQEKIEMLNPWLEEILDSIKKELKNEHLKIDRNFCKKYFLGKSANHIQVPEMVAAYRSDIAEGNVGLGEFIATRWLLKNTEIYGYFEERIKALTSDFEALTELPKEFADSLAQGAVQQFGAKKSYIFSVFNSVVFPADTYARLKAAAEQEQALIKQEGDLKKSAENLEAMQKRHERELAAVSERYEKKLMGLQKKYLQDTTSLKKQIGTLQKKLGALTEHGR